MNSYQIMIEEMLSKVKSEENLKKIYDYICFVFLKCQ